MLLWLSWLAWGAKAAEWIEGDGFRSRPLPAVVGGAVGFKEMDPTETGVAYTNLLTGDAALTQFVAHNGSGVALGDVDADGLPEIYLCGLQSPNRLYRNLGGWRFEAVDAGAAACTNQYSTGAAFADVDGDGDLDLLVNGIASGTRLFRNDGKGGFAEAADSGLSRTASAMSMALADIDGDGDLDLYCTHYIDVMHLADPTTRFSLSKREGAWVVLKVNGEAANSPKWKDRFEALADGSVRELPEIHALYRNDGKGHFQAIQTEPGVFQSEDGKPVGPYRDWGLGVMFRDLNGDSAPDLYVCNDNASPDRIWINNGNGTFRALDSWKVRHTSRSSMGLDVADVDRDGRDDIFVVDMFSRQHATRMMQLVRDRSSQAEAEVSEARPRYNRNTLLMGRADGSFADTAWMAGVAASDWSWCPMFLDVDLDGYEDLLVTNGFEMDVMDQDSTDRLRDLQRQMTPDQRKRSRQLHPPARTRNALFRNRGDGTFVPADRAWGFDHQGVSYGAALADLDGDGDLDVVVNNLNSAAGLYRNGTTAPRLAVRLSGSRANREGVGARLTLRSARRVQSQEMISGGRYLSGDQAMRVFAATNGEAMDLEVRWRSGALSRLTGVSANRLYEVREPEPGSHPAKVEPTSRPPHFREITGQAGFTHVEAPFDDWARQPLLPRRLSRLGPGAAWFDVDGDGWEDLILGAARAGAPGIFLNLKGSGFRRLEGLAPASGDQISVLGWIASTGRRHVLTAESGWETPPTADGALMVYAPTNGAVPGRLGLGPISPGPMASADVDGDGDLDVFVGGRFIPGRYPEAVESQLWIQREGGLERVKGADDPFRSVGMVSGATFADLDGDGDVDLALALEWGSVRVFRNEHGRFQDVSEAMRLTDRKGWWTGISAGDFDGDGRLDLAVGNWGRNSPYELYRPGPVRVYFGDADEDGRVEVVEAWREGAVWRPVRNRTELSLGLPDLAQRFPTHAAFAGASIPEILGPRLATTRHLEADTLESCVLLNRGDHFDWVAFPAEAQRSPSFSLNVGDFDADGREDVFVSQNLFGSASDLSRDDAGTGMWLKGDGKGAFTVLGPDVSGIRVDGEQRGAALADFDHDGRVDLVVTQNNGPVRLFQNQGNRRGLRVRLEGPAGNPDAIGARIRVGYSGGELGPCRTIQAGSGYGSQDGSVPILGLSGTPSSVWVGWPDGTELSFPLPANRWDLTIPKR